MSSLPGARPPGGEEGHLHWERPHWGEGSPLESPSNCSHPRGEDREAEPVHHLRPARCPCPLLESWPPKEKVLEMKQEALQGLVGGEPCRGSRIWGGQRGQTGPPGFQPGAATGIGTRGRLFPPRASLQPGGRWWKQVLPRTPGGRVWKMGDLVSAGTWYAWLVAIASQDFWHGQPLGASLEGMGLLWVSLADKWAAWCGELPPGSTGTTVHPPEGLPPTA